MALSCLVWIQQSCYADPHRPGYVILTARSHLSHTHGHKGSQSIQLTMNRYPPHPSSLPLQPGVDMQNSLKSFNILADEELRSGIKEYS